MLSLSFIRKTTLIAGVALSVIGSTAFAHTTILNQMTEGTTADNALKIGHGCTTPAGSMVGVIAQSAVWPTMNPVVTASDGSAIADLSQVIVQGSLAGLLSPIQSRSIFQQQQLKLDSLGNKIGFSGIKGNLQEPGWLGRVPWQFAPPKFVASSCASQLLIKVAVADICITGGYGQGYVNLWIPDNGSVSATTAHVLDNDEGVGAPATLTINRNLATNPLPAACGAGMAVTVTPSPQDVDTNLSIPGYWDAPTPPTTTAAIEYYYAQWDTYFVTSSAAEIALLDGGAYNGNWKRTGQTFNVWPQSTGTSSPTCRFFSTNQMSTAKSSHFYTPFPAECDTVKQNPYWEFESIAFHLKLAAADGTCSGGTVPLYRLYNNGQGGTPNHRYTTSTTILNQMIAAGWVFEGNATTKVFACAPQ